MSKGDKLCTGDHSGGGVGWGASKKMRATLAHFAYCYFNRKQFGFSCWLLHPAPKVLLGDWLLTSAADTNESVEAMLMLSLRQASSSSMSSAILSVVVEETHMKNGIQLVSFFVCCGVSRRVVSPGLLLWEDGSDMHRTPSNSSWRL